VNANQPASLVEPRHFDDLVDALVVPAPRAAGGFDRIALALQAEHSDFIRFNHGLVRQATTVQQGTATLSVVSGRRRVLGTVSLTGQLDADLALLRDEQSRLVAVLPSVPDDPWLMLCEPGRHSRHEAQARLPSATEVIATVADAAAGLDLVGFHAAGPMAQAYADSTGSHHWHRADSFHMDWCLYAPSGAGAHLRDKAVKADYAGTHWQAAELTRRIGASAERVPMLLRPLKTLQPGAYRAALSPAAVAELLGMLAWSGFSARERRNGTSCLARWATGEFGPMDPRITLREATAESGSPSFSTDGFVMRPEVPLIVHGRPGEVLTGPRSAQETGAPANAGSDDENPGALSLAGGSLPAEQLLASLGTGLYVSNLWYLNFSDQPLARATGMTRFACFWVEDGMPVAPVGVMRFDDSLVRLFGEGLEALTDRVERQPNSDTYGSRRWESVSCPSAIVQEFRLTL
jgi:predicted Zn-dependent protease